MVNYKPFIVIEGIDRSGKSTQTKALVKRLKNDGYRIGRIHFPTSDSPTGQLIKKYLNGEFGNAVKIQPKIASTWYALDRLSYQPLLDSLLKLEVIICDRYVASNIAYQGAKCDGGETDKFIDWVNELEYTINNIKRPDLTILLNVDVDSIKHEPGDDHENDLEFQKRAADVYLKVAEKSGWPIMNCCINGAMRNELDINDELYNMILNFIRLK